MTRMSVPDTTVRLRRGRPRKADAAQINGRILDAAWDLFLEVGFEAATMEQIAERAGITKTTLYLRHDDKYALLRATVNNRMSRWSLENTREGWIVGDTLEERMVSLACRILAAGNHPEILATSRLIHGTTGEAGRIARELDRFMREPMIEELTGEIAEYAHIEGVAVKDPQAVARFFLGMLGSMIDQFADDYGDAASHEMLARQVVAVLFRGRGEW
ncbi:TetR/AcrR family transcriptional regulator [Novosphingobium sp. MW5]|nr:TetR/AcrR family transcriptional regulator [Novosphingobium sp. MW5]